MTEDKKNAMIAKRKATLEKKAKLAKLEDTYSRLASEMPSEWVKNKENQVALLKSIHLDILGVDKNGKPRPMGDFVRFMNVASQAGLNPFMNEIYGLYFYDSTIKAEKMSIITGINGFRKAAAADTTAPMRYVGSGEPVFEMKADRPEWAEVDVPNKATVEIKGLNPITGEIQTVAVGIAYFDEYVKMVDEYEYEGYSKKKTGRKVPNSNWRSKPCVMLKKCAEADGLRKAYPNKLNSVYERTEFDHIDVAPTEEEIEQQENDRADKIEEALKARRLEGKVFEGDVDDGKAE